MKAVLVQEVNGQTVKRCCRCEALVPIDQFSPSGRSKSGLNSICKPCRRVLPEQHRGRCRFIDRTGERYGRLVVMGYAGLEGAVSRTRRWRCQCDCGKETIVTWKQIQANHTRSCGCLNMERLASAGGRNALPEGQSAFNQFFGAYRGSARRRGYTFTIDAKTFRSLTESDCYYCGAAPALKYQGVKGTNGHHIGNGVDRIDNSIGYEDGNVVACCKQCNIAKGVLGQHEFIEWARRVAGRFE